MVVIKLPSGHDVVVDQPNELAAAIAKWRRIGKARRDQSGRDEARKLFAPVFGWFTDSFDTLDLTEAKALPGELAS